MRFRKRVQKIYSAKISPLDFGTEYEYYILCGDKTGETCIFTTEPYVEIPNLNFDTWSQNGKNWYPNSDAANSFWATGNEGVTLGGNSNSIGVEDSRSGLAAQLQTVQVKAFNCKCKRLLVIFSLEVIKQILPIPLQV